jgi:hypothetical protein
MPHPAAVVFSAGSAVEIKVGKTSGVPEEQRKDEQSRPFLGRTRAPFDTREGAIVETSHVTYTCGGRIQ